MSSQLKSAISSAHELALITKDRCVPAKASNSGGSAMMGGGGSSLAQQLTGTGSEHNTGYDKFTGWQYCAIRAIANRAASQQVNMGQVSSAPSMRRMSSYKSWQLEHAPYYVKSVGTNVAKIEDHALMRAINNPNDIMVRWHLFYLTVANLELTGVAYWVLAEDESEQGEPKITIWPMPSTWVKPIHKNGLFAQYKVSPGGDSHRGKIIDGQFVVRFSTPDPSNPLSVRSPADAVERPSEIDNMMQETQYRSFKNGIKPGVVLTAGRLPGDQLTGAPGERPILEAWQRRELVEAIRGAYAGVVNRDEPFIVDGLIESITPFTMSPSEMDYPSSSGLVKSRILQTFGVNPLILGEIEGANRAQAVVAEDSFCTAAVNPFLTLIGETVTKWLPTAADHFDSIPDDSTGILFWFQMARANDPDLKLTEWMSAPGPAVTINEYRTEILHLEPIENGDVTAEEYLAQNVNMGESLIPGSPEQASSPATIKKASAETLKQRKEKIWAAQHSLAEAVIKSQVKSWLRAQSRTVVRKLKELHETAASFPHMTGEEIASHIYDIAQARKTFRNTLEVGLQKAAMIGAATEIAILAESFHRAQKEHGKATSTKAKAPTMPKPVQSKINSTLKTSLNQPHWQSTQKSVRKELATTLGNGIKNGDTIQGMVKSVTYVLGPGSAKRAENIARTEVTGALNAGHDAVINDLASAGVDMTKEWNGTLDQFIRYEHWQAHGQVVQANDFFSVGGEFAPYPGHYSLSPGNRCRCRCVCISNSPFDDPLAAGDALSDEAILAAFRAYGIY